MLFRSAAVAKSIEEVNGVERVDVSLVSGKATVEGEHDAEDVIKAVRSAGFDVVE